MDIAIIAHDGKKADLVQFLNKNKEILIKEKISCVLCEFLNTGAAVREACEELRIPIVSNVLGYEIHKTAILKRNEIQYQKLAQYKSLVVPVAKNMIPKLETLGFKPKQIIYSPLGARMEFFEISPNYRSQQFIAIGRFTESKSPQTTIKAFHQVLKYFPETKLIMAGSGELLEECEELVQNLNIFENVKFVGWINHETQIELLKNSAVFVQHSVTAKNGDAEGTPVAILEASAAGLPIIATRHGGIVDTVVDGETGFLVDENDADEMSNKMIYLLKNPDILEKFGNQGKKFIQENFSMQKHIIEVTNAINTVINS